MLAAASSLAVAATVAQATVTLGSPTPVTVTPAHGTPTTRFTVSFRTPVQTGPSNGVRRWEVASVADSGHVAGDCSSAASKSLQAVGDRQRVSATLAASAKPWCTGSYAGTVTLYRAIICDPGPLSRRVACPEIAFPPQLIGRFRFTVAPAAS